MKKKKNYNMTYTMSFGLVVISGVLPVVQSCLQKIRNIANKENLMVWITSVGSEVGGLCCCL